MSTNVTTRPQLLNANTNVYTAWDFRGDGPQPPGAGVAGYQDFRVMQRQAGANMSVDIGPSGVGVMTAWVRGNTREGQGLYRVDNIDRAAPSTSTYVPQLNVLIGSNASGNPRLDQVVLRVQDSQHAGASNVANIQVITGTPTAGATLDNRNGAGSVPASSILLADVLVANGAASIVTADIRDRRPFALYGSPPAPDNNGVLLDQVTFVPHPGVPLGITTIDHSTLDNQQAAALMYLPRRIVGATRIRWKYLHGGTALTGSYVIAIMDASGRPIVDTGPVAFTGASSSRQARAETIAATTFDAGYYHVLIGLDSTAGFAYCRGPENEVRASQQNLDLVPANALYWRVSGGVTVPQNLNAFTEMASISPAAAFYLMPPMISLSVG